MQTIERVNLLERIVQAIGFTPDFPYTLNVNDGTRNRVEIGKIGSTYGIKIVNNAGVEIVFADGHISATGITTGTLDASIVNVTNLNASNIVTGTLTATRIVGGTLNCSLMTVSNLTANAITTGSMSGDRITTRTLNANRLVTNSITSDELSTGELITQTAQIKNGTIINAHIASLDAGKITTGTLNAITINLNGVNLNGYLGIGGANQPTRIQGGNSGKDDTGYYTFTGGSKMWCDSNGYMGMKATGERFYFYTGSTLYALFERGSQAGFYAGISCEGNLNVADGGDLRINSGYLWVNTYTSPSERLYVEGSGKFVGNLATNHHNPRASNSYNLGGEANYWAGLHVGWIDEHSMGYYDGGVTIEKDGKLQKVSDLEAIKAMRPHPKLKAKSGVPLIDKKSLPIEMYLPAKNSDGTLCERDKGTGYPIVEKEEVTFTKTGKEKRTIKKVVMPDADGENLGELVALTLGAVRELSTRLDALEAKIREKY
jgi:hypothetical protein